jgi:hypothetical protein
MQLIHCIQGIIQKYSFVLLNVFGEASNNAGNLIWLFGFTSEWAVKCGINQGFRLALIPLLLLEKFIAVIGNQGWQVLYYNNSFYESYLTLLGIRFFYLLPGV